MNLTEYKQKKVEMLQKLLKKHQSDRLKNKGITEQVAMQQLKEVSQKQYAGIDLLQKDIGYLKQELKNLNVISDSQYQSAPQDDKIKQANISEYLSAVVGFLTNIGTLSSKNYLDKINFYEDQNRNAEIKNQLENIKKEEKFYKKLELFNQFIEVQSQEGEKELKDQFAKFTVNNIRCEILQEKKRLIEEFAQQNTNIKKRGQNNFSDFISLIIAFFIKYILHDLISWKSYLGHVPKQININDKLKEIYDLRKSIRIHTYVMEEYEKDPAKSFDKNLIDKLGEAYNLYDENKPQNFINMVTQALSSCSEDDKQKLKEYEENFLNIEDLLYKEGDTIDSIQEAIEPLLKKASEYFDKNQYIQTLSLAQDGAEVLKNYHLLAGYSEDIFADALRIFWLLEDLTFGKYPADTSRDSFHDRHALLKKDDQTKLQEIGEVFIYCKSKRELTIAHEKPLEPTAQPGSNSGIQRNLNSSSKEILDSEGLSKQEGPKGHCDITPRTAELLIDRLEKKFNSRVGRSFGNKNVSKTITELSQSGTFMLRWKINDSFRADVTEMKLQYLSIVEDLVYSDQNSKEEQDAVLRILEKAESSPLLKTHLSSWSVMRWGKTGASSQLFTLKKQVEKEQKQINSNKNQVKDNTQGDDKSEYAGGTVNDDGVEYKPRNRVGNESGSIQFGPDQGAYLTVDIVN